MLCQNKLSNKWTSQTDSTVVLLHFVVVVCRGYRRKKMLVAFPWLFTTWYCIDIVVCNACFFAASCTILGGWGGVGWLVRDGCKVHSFDAVQ